MTNHFFKNIVFSALLGLVLTGAGLQAHAQTPKFQWNDKGFVPFQASRVDARFPYMMYVPRDYDENGEKEYPLITLIHGTERGPHFYLERNAEFADKHDVILLAPLFPVGTHGNQDLENYKLLDYKGTRYDLILLSMVDEVKSKYRIRGHKFSMFGFSGGGHFTHRFFYLHPHHLAAISIGAPGMVTRLDDSSDWWVGTRDVYWKFNARLNYKKMAAVKIQMIVGQQDTQEWEDTIEKNSPYNMGTGVVGASYNAAGINRIERLKTLQRDFKKHGIAAQLELVPDAGHDETLMFPGMRKFFIEALDL